MILFFANVTENVASEARHFLFSSHPIKNGTYRRGDIELKIDRV